MKIRKIKWNNHPVLNDFELNLLKSDNTSFDVILFAGENGVGKTSIMESISTFVNQGSFEYFEFIEYETRGKVLTALPAQSEVKKFYNLNDGNESKLIIVGSEYNSKESNENPLTIGYDGCVYSKARADYKTTPILNSTTKQLDLQKFNNDEEEDFTSLKQLLIDIESQDSEEYTTINKNRKGQSALEYLDFYPDSKIFRFSNAFNSFFSNLEYEKVGIKDNEKTVYFKKNEKSIDIDSLSTGEKQIVFRGSYLLRNIKNLVKALIFIDEPELSMHPKWQMKILDFYETLFKINNKLTSQLFFATHSEHVLNNALNKKDTHLVIVLNDENGVIKYSKIDSPSVLPTITSAETNYLAFNIVTSDYHIELFGYLQQKFGLKKIKDVDDYILSSSSFNSKIHTKEYNHPNGKTIYYTLPTYIRNCIDHPDSIHSYIESDLEISIELLINLCK